MLPQLPQDKANHFIYGAVITTITTLLLIISQNYSLLPYCLHPTIIAGIGKEIYDRVSGKGTPEVLDAVATISGGLAVYLPIIAMVAKI
jgi:hypothetical protein